MLTRKDRQAQYKAIEAVRLQRIKNLRQLHDLFPSTAAFARKIGKAATFVSAICGPNPRRDVGEKLAREIEQALKLAPNWLDKEHP